MNATLSGVQLDRAAGVLLATACGDALGAAYDGAADGYFGFVAAMFLAFGLVMEYPSVLVLLSKINVVTSSRLRSSRC